jgi:hypothetical protein
MNSKIKLLLCLHVLASCSDMPYEAMIPLVKSTVFGAERITISDEFYNSQEFSFANVRIGRDINAILILEEIKNDVFVWTSSAGNKLYTYNGKIIRTTGLKHDIELINPKIFSFDNNIEHQFNLMVSNPKAFLEVNSLVSQLSSTEYSEKTSSKLLAWNNENYYRVNNQGMVVYTKQSFHPFESPIEIEFYYK